MDNQKRVYRGNIGKNIDPKDFSNYKDLTKYVRDMMGLLRLCIIQSYGVYKRSELNETEEDFVNEIMNETVDILLKLLKKVDINQKFLLLMKYLNRLEK